MEKDSKPNGNTNGSHTSNGSTGIRQLDASRLIINLVDEDKLKRLPALDEMIFGELTTDYMVVTNYDPKSGWSIPEIKPYGPLTLDPRSSCFQYSTNIFEGMKAYLGPNGEPRLFRPDKNMERLTRSAARMALPQFDKDAVLTLIKVLVCLESRWIPSEPGYSLYIRPTMIGTRTSFGVAASDSACICIFVSPTGPYFRSGVKPINLLAVGENVRAWPGGTGNHKLGLNYSPGFLPQKEAGRLGYDQILWLFGENKMITEAGAMNFFVVVKRDDSENDVDVITPPLDGTILPGLTRASCLTLVEAHSTGKFILPGISKNIRLRALERVITMHDLASWSEQDKIIESFCVGTAVIVAPVGRVGFQGKDLQLSKQGGLGQVGKALWDTITKIQTGLLEFEDWSVALRKEDFDLVKFSTSI